MNHTIDQIDQIDLDHVAIAMERHADAWPIFAARLGGRWKSGGLGPGFAPAQIAYANGMKVELLEPNAVERNDFLRRFLDANGAGPHHLTFKVGDISQAVKAAEEAGVSPVNVDVSDPHWKEAFLHPKQALGVLVQLAQESGTEWKTPPPKEFPGGQPPPATLARVVHAVADMAEGRDLFESLLGGRAEGEGEDPAEHVLWVDLAWPGPGRIRLLSPTSEQSPLHAWLGDRRGRVHHVAFTIDTLDEPATIEPEEACGTRVLLFPTAT